MDEATFKVQVNGLQQELAETGKAKNSYISVFLDFKDQAIAGQSLADGYRTSQYGLDYTRVFDNGNNTTTIVRRIVPWEVVLGVGYVSHETKPT
jgi:hypothetical protein